MDNFVATLLNPEAMDFGERWSDIFFSVEGVCRLVAHTKDAAIGAQLLGAGVKWEGAGWTTGRASRTVFGATGIAMVEEHLKDYLESFLFALSLAYNIDIPKLQLKAQAATAALNFAERVQQRGEDVTGSQRVPQRAEQQERLTQDQPGVVTQEAEVKDTKDGELEPMPWEAQKEDLPEDLCLVMQRHNQGQLQLEARALLEQMPVWKLVKERAEVNNHRQDGMRQQDRLLKGLQQKCLGLLRIYPVIHASIGEEDTTHLGQMFFGLLLQFEEAILQERKRQSIPGSLQQDNVLFSMDDMKIEREKTQLNKIPGKFGQSGVFQFPENRWCLQLGSGPKGFRWRGKGQSWRGGFTYKGGAKGYGKGGSPPWRTQAPKGSYKGWPRGASIAEVATHSGQLKAQGKASHSGPGTIHFNPRKLIWKFGSLQKAQKMCGLVEDICKSSSFKSDSKWNFTPKSPPIFVTKTSSALSKRDQFSPRNFERLSQKWGGEKSGERGHKTLGALVYFVKTRGGGSPKTSFDFGLPRNQSICRDQEISFRKFAKHFPFFKEGGLGSQNRFKGCLLSHPHKSHSKTLSKDGSRGGVLGISRGVFWLKCNATHFHASNENPRKKMESSRHNCLHLFRRYTCVGKFKSHSGKKHWHFGQGHCRGGVQGEHKKVGFRTHPSNSSLGIRPQFVGRQITNFKPKNKNGEKGAWQISDQGSIDMPQNGLNFGPSKKFFGSPSLSKGLHRHIMPICKSLRRKRLELHSKGTPNFEGSIERNKITFGQLGGRPFSSNPNQELHSDSSDNAWGGLDPKSGQFIKDFWRQESILHINVKELKAAVQTVMGLAKKNQTVLLAVDNQVTFYYLTKGGGERVI